MRIFKYNFPIVSSPRRRESIGMDPRLRGDDNWFYMFMLLCLTLLLTSCGFHLQGSRELAPPLHSMYLQTPDPYGHLARDLQQNLKMSNVTLTNTSAEAETVLVILQDDSTQNLVSVGGTQQTRQYELKVVVAFEVLNKRGQTIVPRQTLSESRSITVQSNQILGSSNETNLYYQQMRRRLADALMNRLASIEVTKMINHAEQNPKSS